MPSKNRFEINGDTISIMRDNWDSIAFATYREDYYNELSSHTWTLNNGYPSNGTLGGGLHRYMMAKWYGEDTLKVFSEKGYVVDHMNNNHMDCRISNLEFLKKSYNTAKGQGFDVDSKEMRFRIALSIFKDFKTGHYQITIGCNDPMGIPDSDGKLRLINDIKLLFKCDYSIVVNDAENILREFETEGQIRLSASHACDCRITYAPNLKITEEESKQAFVFRDGQCYLVLGNGKTFIDSVNFDEGWTLPDTDEQ